MSIKDELEQVKQELSSDEKLLEQAFHLEKFFKKYKLPIIAATALLIIAFAGYKVNNYLANQKLEKANSALLTLQKNPKDANALEQLKSNNPKLYALYSYSIAANSGNKDALAKIDASSDMLKDIIQYHIGVLSNTPKESKYYPDLSSIEKAYLLIKNGKKSEAKNILTTIPKTSPAAPVARLLEHYTITK